MNNIVLVGNLCLNNELKNGKTSYLRNVLAVRRDFAPKESDFVPVVFFGKIAEIVSRATQKGDKLGVVGRLQVEKNTDQAGNTKTNISVLVEKVELFVFHEENNIQQAQKPQYPAQAKPQYPTQNPQYQAPTQPQAPQQVQQPTQEKAPKEDYSTLFDSEEDLGF